MKKVLSLVLVLSMLLTLCTAATTGALAEEMTFLNTPRSETLIMEADAGQYKNPGIFNPYVDGVDKSFGIMETPAHPYTRLLMDSIPRVGEKWQGRIALPDVESKEYSSTCCKFANRCMYATEECRKTRPLMTELPGGRMVKCYHAIHE